MAKHHSSITSLLSQRRLLTRLRLILLLVSFWHLQVEELSQRASLLFKLSATLKVSDRRFVSRPAQSRQQQQPLVN